MKASGQVLCSLPLGKCPLCPLYRMLVFLSQCGCLECAWFDASNFISASVFISLSTAELMYVTMNMEDNGVYIWKSPPHLSILWLLILFAAKPSSVRCVLLCAMNLGPLAMSNKMKIYIKRIYKKM